MNLTRDDRDYDHAIDPTSEKSREILRDLDMEFDSLSGCYFHHNRLVRPSVVEEALKAHVS